jgi:hypothetical protein
MEIDMLSKMEKESLERLIARAKHQSGETNIRISSFLLSWWNECVFRSFSFSHLWVMDDAAVSDINVIFQLISRNKRVFPDAIGYEEDFKEIGALWGYRVNNRRDNV